MNTIPELIEDIRAGRMVILVDDEDRENEGDLIFAADHVTPEMINFMAREARGLICLTVTANQLQRLGIPLMVRNDHNLSPNRTAFTVSIESAHGVSTGISAADRSHTIKVAADPKSGPQDIVMPGHIFPIQAQPGGVLKRAGHTEASVDLAALAGCQPAAVICEIMNEDGTMARSEDLKKFAQKHNIKIGTIEDLIHYRIEHDTFVEPVVESQFPNLFGQGFRVQCFRNTLDGREHLAFIKGDIKEDEPTLVRVHSACVLGDVFASTRIRSGESVHAAFQKIHEEGTGVFLYLQNENMGNRLVERIASFAKFDKGEQPSAEQLQVWHSDTRDYGIGAQILRQLGVRRLKLLTNTPVKRVGLKAYGLEIVESVPLTLPTHPEVDAFWSENNLLN